MREILLKWISDAMENPAGAARTEEGRYYTLDMSRKEERCVVHCEDGSFTMPKTCDCISGGRMMKELRYY